jgi:hypothetical protein
MNFNEGMNSGLDFATFMNSALRNNDDGMWGGNGGWLWIFLLILFGGNGNFFNRGAGQAVNDAAVTEAVDAAIQKARADGLSDQVVIEAVKGNGNAIQQLATTLNVDLSTIKTALCSLDKGVSKLSGDIGMSTQQIINAIQSGNMQISSQLANCCCSMKEAIIEQGNTARIQTIEQTNQLSEVMNRNTAMLSNKLDIQTAEMRSGFQGIKDYLCQEKIETLQHQVTQLENAANNAAQTSAISAYVEAAIRPVQAQVTQLVNAVPPRATPAYIIGGNNPYGYNYYNNSGCGCNNGCGC